MGYNEIGLYVQNMFTILGLLVNGNGQCNMLKRKKIFTLNIYLNFESLILVMRDEMTIFVMLTKWGDSRAKPTVISVCGVESAEFL